jgi:hypothetical protein
VGHGRGGGYGLGGLLSLCGRTGEMAISRVRFEDRGSCTHRQTRTSIDLHVRDISGHSSNRLQTWNQVYAYCKHGNIMTFVVRCLLVLDCLGQSQARRHTADQISGRSSHNSITAIFLPTNQAVSHTTTRCATSKTAPKRSQEMVCDRPNQLAITVGLSRKSESWVGTAGQRLRLVLATWYYASVDSAGMESLVYANVLNKNNSN